MEILTVKFKTVTPLFLGGASPFEIAELRARSIKSAMRFWYRAIDPQYNRQHPCAEPVDGYTPTWEDWIFGSSRTGQGMFSIRKLTCEESTTLFDKSRYDGFDDPLSGGGKNTKNGVRYLGFPLETGSREKRNLQRRAFIKAGTEVNLVLHIGKSADARSVQAIAASIWLFGHIGGLGTRSRRGFGTVALKSWAVTRVNGLALPETAHGKATPKEWFETFTKGLNTIRGWFDGKNHADHTVIGDGTKICLLESGFNEIIKKGKREKPTKYAPWEEALNEAGRMMQDFRQRCSVDYSDVKKHLASLDAAENPIGTAGVEWSVIANRFTQAPPRAAFGLPLMFQSSYPKRDVKGEQIIMNGKRQFVRTQTTLERNHAEHTRMASSVFIRIIDINGACHTLFIFMDSPLDGGVGIKDKSGNYALANGSILDTFWSKVSSSPTTLKWP